MKHNESETFCILPFVHFHAESNGDVTPCCVSEQKLGNLTDNSIKDIWSGPEFRKIREAMLSGSKLDGCSMCYRRERSGATSLRQHSNISYEHKIDDALIQRELHPVYFDIRYSNICNLKCRTCRHESSSAWYSDAKSLSLNASDSPNISIREDNQEIVKEISEYAPYIEEVYFAGGEPFLMPEHYSILETLREQKKTDVLLRYNTNLSFLKARGFDVLTSLEGFERVHLDVSIDGVDDKLAYLRKGVTYGTIKNNIMAVKQNLRSVRVRLTVTVSIYNVFDIPAILSRVVEDELCDYTEIDLNILDNPYKFNIQTLGVEAKSYIFSIYRQFINDENPGALMEARLIEVLQYLQDEADPGDGEGLQSFNNKLDALRGENISRVYSANDIKMIFGEALIDSETVE